MKEFFLHYLWRTKRFDQQQLFTTDGEPVVLQNMGRHNKNAGPDFLNARIRIGDTLWAGNVEIHVQSSEWIQHKHQNDTAYDNVILHVVYEEDKPILRKSGQPIPCIELKKRIPLGIANSYQRLSQNEHWIPCQQHFASVGDIIKNLWLDRMLVERLEEKTEHISAGLTKNKNNWEETFYHSIASSFGLKVNVEPFELLAKVTPLQILAKHKNNLFQLEAILFGQSGLLDRTFEEDYPNKLKKEYLFLKKKYNLKGLRSDSWNFLRMRPPNFPTVRIAQFAMLLFTTEHLFSKILAAKNIAELENMFNLQLSNYWLTHYVFDKISIKRKKSLGKVSIHLFIINTIAPFLFIYGQKKNDDRYKDKAMDFLEEIPPEKNKIIDQWKALGFEPDSAYQTQALLQLKKAYCSQQRCLSCAIGGEILK